MYPRITTVRRGGKTYKHLKIIRSYRDKGKVKQQTVASLGSLDSFTQTDVDNIINGLCRIFERPMPDAPPEFEEAPSYGHIHAILHLWSQLKLAQILAKHAKKTRTRFDLVEHIKLMVTNRLDDPKSKLALLVWLQGVYLPGLDRRKVKYHNLLRAMDFLIAHKEDIENDLANQVLTLFDCELDLVFYDMTSSYFETELTDELRTYGYSRDHRQDRPQVTIGVVTTREGIPIYHHVFPGNQSDKTTVQKVVTELKQRFPITRAVFVGDRGMLSRDNVELIRAAGLDYIVATRHRQDTDVALLLLGFQEEVEAAQAVWRAEVQHYRRTGELPEGCESEDEMLSRQRLVAEDEVNGRRLVVEHVEQVSRVSARGRHKRFQRTQDGIAQVLGKLEAQESGQPMRGRKLTESGALLKLHELVKKNRLSEAYQVSVDGHGRVQVVYDDDALAWEEVLDGKLVVETSLRELCAEEVIAQYRDLKQIEDAFRSLKSTLELRPMHHWTAERIRAHVFICMLALTIERLMRVRLRDSGVSMTPKRVFEKLKTLRMVKAKTSGGSMVGYTQPTQEQLDLFKALGTSAPTMKTFSLTP